MKLLPIGMAVVFAFTGTAFACEFNVNGTTFKHVRECVKAGNTKKDCKAAKMAAKKASESKTTETTTETKTTETKAAQ